MLIGVAKETFAGERRVALIPATVPSLSAKGLDVIVEADAGLAAGFPNQQYVDKGASIANDRAAVFAADVVLQVRSLGANPAAGKADLPLFREDQTVIGTFDPLSATDQAREIAKTGATVFALELIPRITRAQSMDVLSSMATVAGYRAVLLGAMTLPKMFPMFMTAAGTIKPAKVFVIGAGVAGLQAIATANRLGAVVSAYDVRPAVKEQVESLGAKFVEMKLEAEAAEDKGGYARQMDEAFYQKQRELMAEVVAESDVVVTTAAIPGKQSPLLITADAVRGMQSGSVIVDLAAERGGNCELSQPDETVIENDVTILGPTNLATEIPYHASQMYSKNISTFLLHLVDDGKIELDLEDEITGETLIARGGEVVNERLLNIMGAKETA
ncbi:MAG: Re/Si-specific NAD(P)(+) transhydrogenase subunit alpha [Pirellulales bacterium]|nr:Re/Si-specific NAD(P)(+) transhydrogenase subunit alpha [Pirellulales bacterium]